IKLTTILTLTLTVICLAGDIVFNPQADHSFGGRCLFITFLYNLFDIFPTILFSASSDLT
ncbi:hypothetical protein JW935_21010, partial [candidate division KSB1 bacterium]|nr:hypothetical protein [candidate division KSB1 bacterium]